MLNVNETNLLDFKSYNNLTHKTKKKAKTVANKSHDICYTEEAFLESDSNLASSAEGSESEYTDTYSSSSEEIKASDV